MATIINNPDSGNDGSNMGTVLALIVLVVLAVIFIVYGLPALRNNGNTGTNVNVPDRVQLDVNTSGNN